MRPDKLPANLELLSGDAQQVRRESGAASVRKGQVAGDVERDRRRDDVHAELEVASTRAAAGDVEAEGVGQLSSAGVLVEDPLGVDVVLRELPRSPGSAGHRQPPVPRSVRHRVLHVRCGPPRTRHLQPSVVSPRT